MPNLILKNSCFVTPTAHYLLIQKRHAGFQAAQSNLSMEMRQRLIERKKKKVEKLSKQPLEFIPVVDLFIPFSWKQDSCKRAVKKTEDILEERILLEKAWSGHAKRKREEFAFKTKQLIKEQERALKELRAESQSLYEEAVQCIELSENAFSCRGPVQTMPISNYLPPLGGYRQLDAPFSTDDTAVPDV